MYNNITPPHRHTQTHRIKVLVCIVPYAIHTSLYRTRELSQSKYARKRGQGNVPNDS